MSVVGLASVVGFRADLKSPTFSYFAIGSFQKTHHNPPQAANPPQKEAGDVGIPRQD